MLGNQPYTKLPTKLAKEPLVEAIFEMRFSSNMPVSSIWPGILYNGLRGEKSMEHLPTIGIPKEIRDQDPNLMYAPVCKVSWGNYWILIGDRVFALASKIPYEGWPNFKASILEAFKVVLDTGMIGTVSRCSLKYIDILEGTNIDPAACFNFELSLGGNSPGHSDFHVRLGVREGQITHTLQVASEAKVSIYTGRVISGPVIDVDSVMDLPFETSVGFLQSLSDRVEELHSANKQVVFNCLSKAALDYLEPSYE